MADSWHWKIGIKRPFGALAKELRAVMPELLSMEGVRWHKENLPKHFGDAAIERYKYSKRSRNYTTKKYLTFFLLRKHGGAGYGKVKFWWSTDTLENMPATLAFGALLLTGRTYAMATRQAQVKASSQRVRISFPVPPYIKWKQNGPDKAEELTRVNESEAELIARRLQKDIVVALSDHRARTNVFHL